MESSEYSPPTSVLVVDDDADVRYVLRLLFEVDGFAVSEASNGAEAVASVLQHGAGYIVLDQMMPGMSGDKVAPVLRSLAPDARIVAFSAALQCKPVWADAFLNKDRIGEISKLLLLLLPSSRMEPV